MAVRFSRLFPALLAFAGLLFLTTRSDAQNNNNNNVQTGGVEIDANGVLSLRTQVDPNGLLDRQQAAAARQSLTQELQQPSTLRKVSLTRLEREVDRALAGGRPLSDDMLHLAGLTRISHVFYYPESRDIVIAGPAEGFYRTGQDRVVGLTSGASTLHLEDLVVALRAFGPTGERTPVIACSIDPTQEGLVRMKQAIEMFGGAIQPGAEMHVMQTFQQAMGMQNITVRGVSPATRMARVLVEADYQMKLIGIGLVQPPVNISSFTSLADPMAVSQNSLQRWFFQPNYDCVRVNEDRTAMQLVGSGVKLVGEDEMVARDGSRQKARRVNRASQGFCASLTREYDRLSRVMPVFGELRNIVDLTIAAAFIQKAGLYQKADWDLTTFGDEGRLPTERYAIPKHVQPVINAVWKDGFFMTPIGGGVNIQPRIALNSDRVQREQDGEITSVRDSIRLDHLAEGQWWWD